MKIIALDTETTGLDPQTDEILQLSLVDENGGEVFNSYFRPERHTTWEDAQAVNGISPELVNDAPLFSERRPEINAIIADCAALVIFNAPFDIAFLRAAGVQFPEEIHVFDVQAAFEIICGEWHWEENRYKHQSLAKCAECCGYDWNGKPHDSLADARAAMYCVQKM